MSELRPAGRLAVGFQGDRAGEGPLTFAQYDTLQWVNDPAVASSAILNWTFELPADVTMTDITETFAVLMARHESLRTTFSEGDEPMQRVADSGELEIQLYQIDAELEREAAAELLLNDLRSQGVDFVAGPPLRVAVACSADIPRVVVAVYSHMIADFGTTAVTGRQFTALISDPAARVPGPRAHQPLDQAEEEQSSRGRRRSDAAIRYWRTNLSVAPQGLYALPNPEDAVPGNVMCIIESPAAAVALGLIAERTKSSRHAITLAAMCAVLTQRTGVHTLVFVSISANRFRSRLHDYVGNLAQDSLIVLETGEGGFDDLVGRAAQATLTANVNSSPDPRELLPLQDQISHQRGIVFARDFVVNNLSVHMNAPAGEQPANASNPAEIDHLKPETTVTWFPASDFPELLLCVPLKVDDGFVLAFSVDTERISRAEIESFARGVESLLIAAAEDDVPLGSLGAVTGIEPVQRGADWLCVDSSWVHLPAVRMLVRDSVGTPAIEVFPSLAQAFGAEKDRLVAYLTATDVIRTPEQAHAACMNLLPERHCAMAPGRYVLVNGIPDDPTDEQSWQKLTVIADGDGRIKPDDVVFG